MSTTLRRPSRLLALLLVLLAFTVVAVARAQSGPGGLEALPAWGVVPSPNGGAGPNQLRAVAVLSPTDVWAVGDYGTLFHPNPAIHRWDGVAWEVVPTPAGLPEGGLLDVDALAPDDVWAVGFTQSTGASLLLHWDGTAWSSVPHPTPYTRQSLNAVDARAPDDIWAVGDYSVGGGISLAYSIHWDGTSWTVVDVPSPNGGYSTLHSVVALAADDVWAVGDDGPDARAVHWDGASWQVVPIPNRGNNSAYFALAALSPTDIWAVGEGWDGQITAHWDGTAWSEVPNPAGGGTFGQLEDIVALATDDVWAVGWFGSALWTPYAMHWDGTSWTTMSPPVQPADSRLFGVATDTSNTLWAVGEMDESLTFRWDGAAWQRIPSANVSNADNTLNDVDALSGSDGWAVGIVDGDALTMRWNGSTWGLVPVAEGTNVALEGVAMAGAADVWAVGWTGSPASLDSSTVTLHWTGSMWARVPSPNPGGSEVDRLHAVAALAPDDVWAVGTYGGTGDNALILHWTGSAWQTAPNSCGGPLHAIDARSPSDIWVAGDDTVCHYDGGTWTAMNPPSVPLLFGVEALAPDDVWVVGQVTFCGPKSCTTRAYSARWDGSAWQEEFIPSSSMQGIFGYAPDNLFAVGTDSIGTAIAHWDGSQWNDVPAADPGAGGFLNGISPNGQGGYWAVGSFLTDDGVYLERTLVMDAPSATQGAVFGETGYSGSTILWLGPVTGSTTASVGSGRYSVGGLPAGSYTFFVIGAGCDPQQAAVQVFAGEHVRQDFDLCGPQPTPAPTRTPGASPTSTSVPPTPIASPTSTSVPPTPTASPTSASVPPTPGASPTATSVPPTAAPTAMKLFLPVIKK